MVTLSSLLQAILEYEVELKGIYLILALVSVLVGIIIKLRWKPNLHHWFTQWLIQQEVVVERKRSTLGVLAGLGLLLLALGNAAQSNGGSMVLLLPALYLIMHKRVRIRTQPMRTGPLPQQSTQPFQAPPFSQFHPPPPNPHTHHTHHTHQTSQSWPSSNSSLATPLQHRDTCLPFIYPVPVAQPLDHRLYQPRR